MIVRKSPQEIFVEGARAHGAATIDGNTAATNRAYKKLISALRKLREMPDHGQSFLAGLLQDEDPSVVTWSALHLLPISENEALYALQKVQDTAPPLIAFGAEMTLREWEAGRLTVE